MRSTRLSRSAPPMAANQRRESAARSPPRRPRACKDLSLHPVAAGRLPLPTSADLLRVRRRGARPLWAMGRFMDDSRPPPSLPSLGHIGDRPCARDGPGGRALVRALALRSLVLASPHRLSELLEPPRRFARPVLRGLLVPGARF